MDTTFTTEVINRNFNLMNASLFRDRTSTPKVTSLNSSLGSTQSEDSQEGGKVLPGGGLYWFGEPYFYVIHILAICVLSTSVLASFCTILFLFISDRRAKKRGFFSWNIAERLVVYLAIFDLGSSMAHASDHVNILVTLTRPPRLVCSMFGALVVEFILGQGLVVIYTAVRACYLVIWQKKITLGRYDWRLMGFMLAVPTVYTSLGVVFGYLGFSGAWCLFAIGSQLGRIMNIVKGGLLTLIFVASAVCYGAIWWKVRSSGPNAESKLNTDRKRRYHKSARVMLLFIMAYLFQWFPMIVYDIWALWEPPGRVLLTSIVIFSNWGGVFNAIAYTVMRRKYLSSPTGKTPAPLPKGRTQVPSSTGDHDSFIVNEEHNSSIVNVDNTS